MDTKIKTLIFDCFGVICDPVMNGWYEDHRLKKGLVDENINNVFNNYDMGKFSEGDIAEYFLKYNEIDSTKEEIIEEIDDYLKLDSRLAAMILDFKNKGFKTVLLSNSNASFFEEKLYKKYPGFKKLFDEIIISSSVGMVKPNEDIFLYALEKTNSKPEEVLFIDDSKKNVKAAIKLGMKGYVYKNFNSFVEYIKNNA